MVFIESVLLDASSGSGVDPYVAVNIDGDKDVEAAIAASKECVDPDISRNRS